MKREKRQGGKGMKRKPEDENVKKEIKDEKRERKRRKR